MHSCSYSRAVTECDATSMPISATWTLRSSDDEWRGRCNERGEIRMGEVLAVEFTLDHCQARRQPSLPYALLCW